MTQGASPFTEQSSPFAAMEPPQQSSAVRLSPRFEHPAPPQVPHAATQHEERVSTPSRPLEHVDGVGAEVGGGVGEGVGIGSERRKETAGEGYRDDQIAQWKGSCKGDIRILKKKRIVQGKKTSCLPLLRKPCSSFGC